MSPWRGSPYLFVLAYASDGSSACVVTGLVRTPRIPGSCATSQARRGRQTRSGSAGQGLRRPVLPAEGDHRLRAPVLHESAQLRQVTRCLDGEVGQGRNGPAEQWLSVPIGPRWQERAGDD